MLWFRSYAIGKGQTPKLISRENVLECEGDIILYEWVEFLPNSRSS